jgi:hypothetical protein
MGPILFRNGCSYQNATNNSLEKEAENSVVIQEEEK